MKQILQLITFFAFVLSTQAQDRFTSYNTTTNFSALTVDGLNSKVWAGTSQNGIFKLNIGSETTAPNFTVFNGDSNFANLKVKSMAADKLGNVWIANHGVNFVGSQGGVYRINSQLNVKHYWPERNFRTHLISYFQNDGVGNLRTNALSVDKNNTVWVANHYRDLTSSPNYFLMPGTMSYKTEGSPKFTSKGGWKNSAGVIATQASETPYPAFTTNPPASQTPQARVLDAISSDDTLVWVGMRGYLVDDGDTDDYNNPYIPNRILTYNLDGTLYNLGTATNGGFSFEDMGFAPGGVIYAICANNEKGTWTAVSIAGRGFSVHKAGVWTHIDHNTTDSEGISFSNLLASDTRFNKNAMWHDRLGRVFMGTDKGLIVYNGNGDPTKANSYKIYSNTAFGGTGNPLNVIDTSMSSNNIQAGCSNPNNVSESWIASDQGVMKLILPIEGVTLHHIKDDYTYGATTQDNSDNLTFLSQLSNKSLTFGPVIPALENEIPMFAADGSNATIIRINADNTQAQGHYNLGSESFKLFVGPGPVDQIFTADYIKRYGYFYLKDLSSYPNNPSDASELEYVEYYYKHPEFIHEDDFLGNANYAEFDFSILDVTDSSNNIEVFKHPVKIHVPPVLLAHGVWTSVESFDKMEESLINNGFKDYMLLKAWRFNKDLAENSFSTDAWVIPEYINRLKHTASLNNFSAGKVNIVAHSRGGLYTRAFIGGLENSPQYKDVINSLITLNTPHFGSQGGNLALDKRVILTNRPEITGNYLVDLLNISSFNGLIPFVEYELKVGDLGSLPAPEADRENGWGARNLMVEIDNISGVVPPEDTEFITRLKTLSFENVPLHTVSTTYSFCTFFPNLCNDLSWTDGLSNEIPLAIKAPIAMYKTFTTAGIIIPNGLDNITSYVYNNEGNDIVVPLSSMKAGLAPQFNSHFTGIAHSTLAENIIGVTEAPIVQQEILDLLKSNTQDTSGHFTKNGITPNELEYAFLENLLSTTNKSPTDVTSNIFINRDPAVFDNINEGDVLTYNIYAENVDEIMVVYENENNGETFSYETMTTVNFENTFNFPIPVGYSGKTKITANGYKNGELGFSTNTIEFSIGTPSSISVQSIYFTQEDPMILNSENYSYIVKGTYTDGIDRILDNATITFDIEDSTIISQIDDSTLKGELTGSTILSASLNGLEDSVLVTVMENPSLSQTILTTFYGTPSTDNTSIDLNWETLHEFENATFAIETSYNTPDNFTEINQQAGNGTLSDPAQFSYTDDSFGSNTLIYYRIKMISTSGDESYSATIEINLSTLATEENLIEQTELTLFPNPTDRQEVTLQFNSKIEDRTAKLELFSLQGKKLSKQTISVVRGNNNFNLKIGSQLNNGIYFVRLKTKSYIKTVKLIIEK